MIMNEPTKLSSIEDMAKTKMNIAVNDMNACGGRVRKRVFRALVKSFLSRF